MKATRTFLWEFLLDLLNRNDTETIIRWTKKNNNEFKLINPQEIAARWGHIKNKPKMNIDKFTRSLRFYYVKGIINKVPNQHFTYRFGSSSEVNNQKRLAKRTRLETYKTNMHHFDSFHSLDSSSYAPFSSQNLERLYWAHSEFDSHLEFITHDSKNNLNTSGFDSHLLQPIKHEPMHFQQNNISFSNITLNESNISNYSGEDLFDKKPDYSIYSSIFETNPLLTNSHLQYQKIIY